jgi:hypothetical protein
MKKGPKVDLDEVTTRIIKGCRIPADRKKDVAAAVRSAIVTTDERRKLLAEHHLAHPALGKLGTILKLMNGLATELGEVNDPTRHLLCRAWREWLAALLGFNGLAALFPERLSRVGAPTDPEERERWQRDPRLWEEELARFETALHAGEAFRRMTTLLAARLEKAVERQKRRQIPLGPPVDWVRIGAIQDCALYYVRLTGRKPTASANGPFLRFCTYIFEVLELTIPAGGLKPMVERVLRRGEAVRIIPS